MLIGDGCPQPTPRRKIVIDTLRLVVDSQLITGAVLSIFGSSNHEPWQAPPVARAAPVMLISNHGDKMSDIDTLTIKDAREAVQRGKEIEKLLSDERCTSSSTVSPDRSGFIGRYVIVRCRDAGVHAGVLRSYDGRSCILDEARRLWSWRVPSGSSSFLSGVAIDGLADGSQVGAPITVMLTENCEIILTSDKAESSIKGFATCTRAK